MLPTILIVLFSALIGAYIRYEARERRRPWLVTAALAAMLADRFRKSPERLYSEIMRALMSAEPEDEAP